MRFIFVLIAAAGIVAAQSMTEAAAVIAGSTVGSAAGKSVSDGINTSLKKTGGILDKAASTGSKPASASAVPTLQVSPGRPKAELNNVPPPPPPARRVAARPAPRPSRPAAAVLAPEPAAMQQARNVDLSTIVEGTPRARLLELGDPSARITMYEDGHLVEIFHYRNETLASGTVRLRDGSVSSVEARP